jgi:alpha-beta hydrolase superfamily lysophospholipase
LLAGSGPADRDATMGRNKVLKDLAWGLASRGIAVLRFDKVTYTHRGTLDVTDFTVIDEYVRPAVSAVGLLREHPSVDAARVFVLGHSQGGTVARASRPRNLRSPGWSCWPVPHSRCTMLWCASFVTSQHFASQGWTSTPIRASR